MKKAHQQGRTAAALLGLLIAAAVTAMALASACSAGDSQDPILPGDITPLGPDAFPPDPQPAAPEPEPATPQPETPATQEPAAEDPQPRTPASSDGSRRDTGDLTEPPPTAPGQDLSQPGTRQPGPTTPPTPTAPAPTPEPVGQPQGLTIEPQQATLTPGQEWTPTAITLHLSDGSTRTLRPDEPGITWSLGPPTGDDPLPETLDAAINDAGAITTSPRTPTATILATATHENIQAEARLDIRASAPSEHCTPENPRADLLLDLDPQTPPELLPHIVNNLAADLKAIYPYFSALTLTVPCTSAADLDDTLSAVSALQPVRGTAPYSPTPGDLEITQTRPIVPQDYSSITMRPTQSLPLPVHQALFSDNSIRTMTSQALAQLTYTMAEPEVAHVHQETHSIRAMQPGITTMTVAHQGDTLAEIKITVTAYPEAPVTSLRAIVITAGLPLLLHPGGTASIQVKARTADGRSITLDPQGHGVTFTPASFRVSVDHAGTVTARAQPSTPHNTGVTITHAGLVTQQAIHLRKPSPPPPRVDQDCRHHPTGAPGPIPGNLFVVEMPWTQHPFQEPDHPLLSQASTLAAVQPQGQRHPHQLVSLPCQNQEQLDRAHQALLLHPQVTRAHPYTHHPDDITVTGLTPVLDVLDPYPGMQVPLAATVHLSDGTRRPATPGEIASFSVTTSTPSILSIDPNGTITARMPGQATLQLQHQGTLKTVRFTVLPIPISPACAYLKQYAVDSQKAWATVVDLTRVDLTLTRGSGPADAHNAAAAAGGSIPRDRKPTVGRTKYTAILRPPCQNPWLARWEELSPFLEAPDTILQHPAVTAAAHQEATAALDLNPPPDRPGFPSTWHQDPPGSAHLTDIVTHVHRLDNINPQTPVHLSAAGHYADGSTGRLRTRDLERLTITSLDPQVLQVSKRERSRTDDPDDILITSHHITALAPGRGRLLIETAGIQETATVRVRNVLAKRSTQATQCTAEVRDQLVIRDQTVIRTSDGATSHQVLAIAHGAGTALMWSSGDGRTHLLQHPCRPLSEARQRAWSLPGQFAQVESAHPHILPKNH